MTLKFFKNFENILWTKILTNSIWGHQDLDKLQSGKQTKNKICGYRSPSAGTSGLKNGPFLQNLTCTSKIWSVLPKPDPFLPKSYSYFQKFSVSISSKSRSIFSNSDPFFHTWSISSKIRSVFLKLDSFYLYKIHSTKIWK